MDLLKSALDFVSNNALLAAVLAAGIVGLLGWLLTKPKIVVLSPWKLEHKGVYTPDNSTVAIHIPTTDFDVKPVKYPSTSEYIYDEPFTHILYNYYGITIQNGKKRSVSILGAYIRFWDSHLRLVNEIKDELYLWKDRHHPTAYPLFPGKRKDPGQTITLGAKGTLDLPILYNREYDNMYYRYTVSSPLTRDFPPMGESLGGMPHYAIVELQGDRLNKTIYLRLDEIKPLEVEISILIKGDFPVEIRSQNGKI